MFSLIFYFSFRKYLLPFSVFTSCYVLVFIKLISLYNYNYNYYLFLVWLKSPLVYTIYFCMSVCVNACGYVFIITSYATHIYLISYERVCVCVHVYVCVRICVIIGKSIERVNFSHTNKQLLVCLPSALPTIVAALLMKCT